MQVVHIYNKKAMTMRAGIFIVLVALELAQLILLLPYINTRVFVSNLAPPYIEPADDFRGIQFFSSCGTWTRRHPLAQMADGTFLTADPYTNEIIGT